MKIACLFDGAGLARLGLEKAGHECTGFEIDPAKHHLSKMVGSGNSVLADVRNVDLSGFDAVWASPPCQKRSKINTKALSNYEGYDDLLAFSLALPHDILWVENVISSMDNGWGTKYNAAQFEQVPRQVRGRIIGGRYKKPVVYRDYKASYLGDGMNICPAILASEYDSRPYSNRRGRWKASDWYGRRLSVRECAYHQGFDIPDGLLKSWFHIPGLINPSTSKSYTYAQWRNVIYEAIGNGVPVYMAYAFGQAYSDKDCDYFGNPLPAKQLVLF